MPRFRVTVIEPPDRAEQLRRASRIRQDLIERIGVRLDPECPLPGVHRDERARAYLEFAADDLDAVRRLLHEAGHDAYAELSEPREPLGEACADCGNVAGPVLPATCPNCGFHDISRCPICGELHPRPRYERISGDLFRCPTAREGLRHRVRLAFNEPLFNQDGTFHQPLVVVREDGDR